jgi:tubulin-specific chaperone E
MSWTGSLSGIDSSVPNAGSFIRPTKKSDNPTSFLQSLHQKYSPSSREYMDIFLESSGKQIEMIGFEKVEKQQS